MKKMNFRGILLFALLLCASFNTIRAGEYYQINFYHIDNDAQELKLEKYIKNAYLPALHRIGIESVGVFKTIKGANEDSRMLVMLIPLKSLKQLEKMETGLEGDEVFIAASNEFRSSAHDAPPYQRLESSLLQAFSSFPSHHKPEMQSLPKERVYELRNYESATEELHRKKVKMFNEGESEIFIDLGFQPMFFARAIVGANMPNLVYMTCHENESMQKVNWDKFRKDPRWEKMKGMDEYRNTVSKIHKWMLYPTDYSDL
jgi:hypothetical protein